ncbi:MAG: OadG family protein [Clostridia bacterium]|nr:OadG family protein [Clostridia bacterium]
MSVLGALGEGIMVTVVGLCIVFAVLVILMFVLMLMKKIFYKETKVETTQETEQKVQPVFEEDDEISEHELIAVLTAAIAASLNTSTYNLKIKSYKRISSNAPAWNRAGITETINSRY